MRRQLKLFIDFDGTITKEDVGDAIFREFGDPVKVNEVIRKLLSDEISAKQCWTDLCKLIDSVNKTEIQSFIDVVEIDPSFHNLVKFCSENKIPFYVLSDGFDLYINRIFDREKLPDIKYFSNRLEINQKGKLIPFFPYFDSSCRYSASCKTKHIINNSSDDEITVFIGDGNSDKETVHYCDYIFAKDDLLKYCEKERITYFPFNNFNDVILRLDSLLVKKNLKKRHQADLKRKEAYRIE